MKRLILGVLVVCIFCTDIHAAPKVYLDNGLVIEGKKVYLSDAKITLIQRKGLFSENSEDFPKEQVLAVVDGTSVLFSQKGVGFMEITEYPGLLMVPVDAALFLLVNWQLKKGAINKGEANTFFVLLGIGTLMDFIPKKEIKPVLVGIPYGEEEKRQTQTKGKESLQALHLSFPLKATIYRTDGGGFSCTVKGINAAFVEYQAALFGTDKIAIKDVEYLETVDGVKLERNDLWAIGLGYPKER